jgi:pimeloyl-ACP methyl ester carboxylesterase
MLKKLGIVIFVLLLIAAAGMVVMYSVDGQPLPETETFMQGTGYTAVEESDGSLVFTPEQSNGFGILLMHGALIKPKSYAASAAYFATRGYLVYIPYGGVTRLSINAIDKAAARLDSFGVDDWYLIGHSMGGMVSMEFLRRHDVDAKAVAMWAASMPVNNSDIAVPVLFIWGSNDGLLPQDRFESGKAYLPADTTYLTLEGANHKDFSMYSHQFFDNEGLGWQAQTSFANEQTAKFFADRQ